MRDLHRFNGLKGGKQAEFRYDAPVLLLGGGACQRSVFDHARIFAPHLICADGGADRALAFGVEPERVIGDLDSLSEHAKTRLKGRLQFVEDQNTTDFEKCLTLVHAPLLLGLGFMGRRWDHQLATLNSLTKFAFRPVVLVGKRDLCFLAPARFESHLPVGTRYSLFPMSEAAMRSEGLGWPIEGLKMSPVGKTSTSNIASAPKQVVTCDKGHVLVILPARFLSDVMAALLASNSP